MRKNADIHPPADAPTPETPVFGRFSHRSMGERVQGPALAVEILADRITSRPRSAGEHGANLSPGTYCRSEIADGGDVHPGRSRARTQDITSNLVISESNVSARTRGNKWPLRFLRGWPAGSPMSTTPGADTDSTIVAAGLSRDELLELLEGPLAELARKIEVGRIRDVEHEETRIKQWRALAYVARAYNDILNDAEEQNVDARLEALETELGLAEGTGP